MHYSYTTKGTCSSEIEFDLDGDVVHNVQFVGGCNGNLKAISSLVDGLTVEQVVDKVKGITCAVSKAHPARTRLQPHCWKHSTHQYNNSPNYLFTLV